MTSPESHQTGLEVTASPWSPFKILVFRYLWLATLISNTGSWMHEVGAGWLMATLTASPFMVALMQTATSLPVFLLAIPAGALADIFDRRIYLITAVTWMMVIALALGVLTVTGATNEWILVTLTFALGIGTAMIMPALAAITPELVPRPELHKAVALNAMGINVSRAVGPALAGVIIAAAGSGAVFLINTATFLLVVVVLWKWKRQTHQSNLPAERFITAIRTGLRFASHATALQATLVRSLGFFIFASALWALLPLVAKDLLHGGPKTYGVLLASIGAGAVAGALVLPAIRVRYSSDQMVAGATVIYSIAMLGTGFLKQIPVGMVLMAICGAAWITMISTVSTATQLSLPNWVRSRGLSIMLATLMGSLAFGSILWGSVAKYFSISAALTAAALCAMTAVLFTRRWHISQIEKIDLTPSMHWDMPITHAEITHNRGPVMVVVHYRVLPKRRDEFLALIQELGRSRKRDGAYAWDVMEDVKDPEHFIEYYLVESWLEHLRQHERVTNADKMLQDKIKSHLQDRSQPDISHFVGA